MIYQIHQTNKYFNDKANISVIDSVANAQAKIIEKPTNAYAVAESDELDHIILKLYVYPSSKGPGKGVKMSAKFYKYDNRKKAKTSISCKKREVKEIKIFFSDVLNNKNNLNFKHYFCNKIWTTHK